MSSVLAPVRFALPEHSEATAPAETRGVPRDGVRLLVAGSDGIDHRIFRDLPDLLSPGDVVVVNTSATIPAAVDAVLSNGRSATVHVAGELDDGRWVVEVRRSDNRGVDSERVSGEHLTLPGGVDLRLDSADGRLWRATTGSTTLARPYLMRHGRPIAYDYLAGRYPLSDYQNVYATTPGSAEMASAGRPFTHELIVRLVARGITIAPVTLHAGVSSPELHEPPQAERFQVPPDTARVVESARSAGRRVVAVGTTVVRALETAADADAVVRPAEGWTNLLLGADRLARVVTGLITGLHAPEASHLLLLEAVAGRERVAEAYEHAVAERYLWHEFGDSMLFLP